MLEKAPVHVIVIEESPVGVRELAMLGGRIERNLLKK